MYRINELISTEFQRVLERERLSVKAAAKLLSVSRQSMHSYLSGLSVPRGARAYKARDLWGFRITEGQVSLDADDPTARANENEAVQLPLDFQQTVDAIRREACT